MYDAQVFTLCEPFYGRANETAILKGTRPDRAPKLVGAKHDALWATMKEAWEEDPVKRPPVQMFETHFGMTASNDVLLLCS
jgi:hypothetical protein